MRLAIKEARKNLKAPAGATFGSCIVKARKAVAVARNTVFKEDATCHAEINAIKIASKRLKTYDLSGCVMYTTTEPCPMCFGAIHWAGINTVIFGTRIADAARTGFNELSISAAQMKRLGGSSVKVVGDFLADECGRLFTDWRIMEEKRPDLIDRRTPYFAKRKKGK
jgi:guanine deaminase